ncbi:membrane-bound serine protease (ClpP class) [Thiohalophilus thiocyanatoxydans]|uniref:Membrane-bound serine protease (ClpP class) n=2 Tax=Thiohalophilus thiocyanatoxydans TaxID=381308 RepID=A0A4R8IYN5_9GAMM|nr:membrane-bound serine protease (ClpP class) [Thiohalophilus thiocyanatoxydans]
MSLLLLVIITAPAAAEETSTRSVLQLSIEDVIGPATEDYITRAIESAPGEQAGLILIRMDTPGGLDSAMRGIIKSITSSPIPVVTYVAPTGSRAASAGTYILYASHIAAMAPGTNLGAATPVKLGGSGQPGDEKPASEQESDKPDPGKSASERKAINDAVAYIRGLAELRGRNAEWAEQAVRQAASLSAGEALEKNVIDLVARSNTDLLQQLDGRKLDVLDQEQVLNTRNMPVKTRNPDWRSRLLSVITNPNIAYILMLIGIYGLIFEFSNPGAIVPGTVGAIALLLGLYSLQLLPVNYAGMALIILGIALMIGEAYQPSFGILGIGGVIAFVFGSIILIDTTAPGYGINPGVIAAFALSSVLMFVVVVGLAMRSRRRPVVSGMEQLLGGTGKVITVDDHRATILIHSEHWQAVSDQPLQPGQRVRVTAAEGLTLTVEPLNESTH